MKTLALTVIASALLAAPALAQSPAPPGPAASALPAAKPEGTALPGAMTQGQVSPATMTGALGRPDASFASGAARGNTAELQAADVALQRGSSRVREFAQHMIDDHTKAGKKLTAILAVKHLRPASGVSAQSAAELAKLKSLSGAAFNSTYISGQIRDHEAMAALMQAEMKNGKDTDLVLFAKQTLPVVQSHLAMARSLAAR